MKVVLIDYGAGNIQSVRFALNRLGVEPALSSDPEAIRSADKVIFPGVGEAGSAMRHLRKSNLENIIPQLTQPFLGICLGMQLMCDRSEEGDTTCLGIIPGTVQKFIPENGEKVPHMGWNSIRNGEGTLFQDLDGAHFYFVHSYYVPENEFTIALTDYVLPFSAGIRKDNFYACQFHPEKSGLSGSAMIEKFLQI